MIATVGGRLFETHPAAVVVPVVTQQEEFLLLENPLRPGWWEPVNGAVEKDETLLDAALREVREEVGSDLRVRPLGVVHASTFAYDAQVTHVISVTYLMAYLDGVARPGDDMQRKPRQVGDPRRDRSSIAPARTAPRPSLAPRSHPRPLSPLGARGRCPATTRPDRKQLEQARRRPLSDWPAPPSSRLTRRQRLSLELQPLPACHELEWRQGRGMSLERARVYYLSLDARRPRGTSFPAGSADRQRRACVGRVKWSRRGTSGGTLQ